MGGEGAASNQKGAFMGEEDTVGICLKASSLARRAPDQKGHRFGVKR